MKLVKKLGSSPLIYKDESGASIHVQPDAESEVPDEVYERYKHKLELIGEVKPKLKESAQSKRKPIKAKKVDTGVPDTARESVEAD